MRVDRLVIAAASIFLIGTQDVSAQRKCGFGMWELGERCRQGVLICERARFHGYNTGTKQWKCWHRKGVRWRPNKKAKMQKFHWF